MRLPRKTSSKARKASHGSDWNQEQQAAVADLQDGRRRPFTGLEDHKLVKMHAEGRTNLEMALELRRSWHSVQGRLSKLRKKGRIPPYDPVRRR